MPRILAVDWGERRIGLAVSDPTGTIATGLPTIVLQHLHEGPKRVAEAARECEAESIVVGLPLLLSGERGEAAHAATAFADKLAQVTGLPVDMLDERLTSALSQRRVRESGGRAGRGKGAIDQGAAVALLESWLMQLETRARIARENAARAAGGASDEDGA